MHKSVVGADALRYIILKFKVTINLSKCSRDARKPIAVPVRKLSAYLQPFRRNSFHRCKKTFHEKKTVKTWQE